MQFSPEIVEPKEIHQPVVSTWLRVDNQTVQDTVQAKNDGENLAYQAFPTAEPPAWKWGEVFPGKGDSVWKTSSRRWFQICFIIPNLGEMIQIYSYFSNGLKPPSHFQVPIWKSMVWTMNFPCGAYFLICLSYSFREGNLHVRFVLVLGAWHYLVLWGLQLPSWEQSRILLPIRTFESMNFWVDDFPPFRWDMLDMLVPWKVHSGKLT